MENNNYNEFDGYEGPGFFCVVYQNFYPHIDNTQIIILDDGTKIGTQQDVGGTYTFFDYYKQFYKDTFIDRFKKPHMIYTGIGSIRQFENMKLTKEEIDYLNVNGLNIFLYENLIFELGEKKKFYISENKSYRPISFHLQFEITPDTLDSVYSFELESINQFVKNNKLTSVQVLTCEYKSNDFFKDRYEDFVVKSKDIFIQSLFEIISDKVPNSYQHNFDLINNFTSDSINYKFWCTNWRYDIHRHLIALYLADKSALLSWPYKNSITDVKEKIWFDFDQWKAQSVYSVLKSNDDYIVSRTSPMIIDLPLKKSTSIELDQIYNTPVESMPGGNPNADPIPVDYIKQCFCAVVTESAYAHPLANFTEKTLTVIKSMRPFVLVAPPYTLEYLQKLGFKTFNDIWDESYDSEINHEQRLLKIFNTLEWINALTVEELKQLYDKLLPVLQHNFNHLKKIKHSDLIL